MAGGGRVVPHFQRIDSGLGASTAERRLLKWKREFFFFFFFFFDWSCTRFAKPRCGATDHYLTEGTPPGQSP